MNANHKQTNEERMEELFNNLTFDRFRILAALNDKLVVHGRKLCNDVQSANEEIEKLKEQIDKMDKANERKRRRKQKEKMSEANQ